MSRPRATRLAQRMRTHGVRCCAAVAALVWLVSVELLPAAHLAGHARLGAHLHDAAGETFLAAHVHAHGVQHAQDTAEASRARMRALRELRRTLRDTAARAPVQCVAAEVATRVVLSPELTHDAGHGAHSLLHRTLALHRHAPVCPAVPCAAVARMPYAVAAPRVWTVLEGPAPSARGPPHVAA